MKWKLAAVLAIVFWLLMFARTVFLPLAGLDIIVQIVVHGVMAAVLAFAFGYIYCFKDKGTFKSGFLFGAFAIIIGLILDTLLTVPFFVKGYDYYLNPVLWIGFAVILVVAGLSGKYRGKKSERKFPVYGK